MTGAEAVAFAVRQLRAAGIEEPARDARRLLAHALGVTPDRVMLELPQPLAAPEPFFALIERRAAHEPVSKITGLRSFWGRDFTVTPEVLDPRPETELLVELALAEPFQSVLDLGTGTGCILLTLLAERPRSTGQGVDLSAEALAVAAANAATLGLADRARLTEGDWFAPVRDTFDLIVSNPPYIAADEIDGLAPDVRDWDPRIALTVGGDGLGAYRAILDGISAHLAPGGRLIVEIGWQQGSAVAEMMRAAGLDDVEIHTDLNERDRALSAKKLPLAGSKSLK